MKKILIAEDETALREAYTFLFSSQGFETFAAENGKEALTLLKKHKPDFVVLDILMPVMSGIDFLQSLDLPKDFPHTKILALSNLSDQKTINQVLELGASKYLLKASVTPKELIAAIQEL